MKNDSIQIIWHIEDVRSVAPDLTDEQCRTVLHLAAKNHDANYGINWDTLEHFAYEVCNSQSKPQTHLANSTETNIHNTFINRTNN